MTTTETKKRTPKKGDTIWVVRIWNRGERIRKTTADRGDEPCQASLYVRKLRVESWGKQQATFTDLLTGEYLGRFGHTDPALPYCFTYSWTYEGLADEIVRLTAELRERRLSMMNCQQHWLNDYQHTSRPEVVQHAREILAKHAALLDVAPEILNRF